MSAARTLPVTPAERACATVLRAWLEWQPSPEDDASKEARACMFDFGGSLRANDFVTRGQATPAGAAERVGPCPRCRGGFPERCACRSKDCPAGWLDYHAIGMQRLAQRGLFSGAA